MYKRRNDLVMKKNNNCPCGSGIPFGECCEPYILGSLSAEDPERLLRSRFSAYTTKNVPYIYATWHEKYRPVESQEDFLASLKNISFTRLVIESKKLQGDKATIIYRAFCKKVLKNCQIREKANFIFENGHWLYTDGTMLK